ncbi:MAG: hypothetical protein JSS37_06600 [Proteobacteria bacterium]|nr:hypothetical protein [Pseudomonadota bacterium]
MNVLEAQLTVKRKIFEPAEKLRVTKSSLVFREQNDLRGEEDEESKSAIHRE